MLDRRQALLALALATTAPGLAAQNGVSVGGFETRGSVGLDVADYRALGRALTALLGARLGERADARVVAIAPDDGSGSGRIDIAAARVAAAKAGAKLLVVGSLLDQYGDIQVEARLIDAGTGQPIAVVRGDPSYIKREQLAQAITALADQLTRQPGVGGKPGSQAAGIPLDALVQFGRGLEAESAGNRAAAATAYRAALTSAPEFSEAQSALQRVGG